MKETEWYDDLREITREKKNRNHDWSIKYLEGMGYKVELVDNSTMRYKVNDWIFYPTTGFFQKGPVHGRGVKALKNKLKKTNK